MPEQTAPLSQLYPGRVAPLLDCFRQEFGREAAVVVRAPGRVNLLGAHLDYNEGWVLPGAIDRAVWLAAAPRDDRRVRIVALNFGETAVFRLPQLTIDSGRYPGPWINYPLGVAWALQEAGHILSGMDVVVVGDVPIGAGLSSSAAVEMALVLAWEALSDFELDNLARAQIGRRAENEYLDVSSGIMDQFVCLYGCANHLVFLDCRTLSHELAPVADETAVCIADSGVRRQLTAIDYNSRPQQCREAVALLQEHLPDVATLRDVSMAQFERHAHHLPPLLRWRARHVVSECARVHEGVAALRRGDMAAFGRLMQRSQASSRDNYENSIPELDVLAAAAASVEGCYGARFGGGGFGGCMQVLAAETAVGPVRDAMCEAFIHEFGRVPATFTTKIGRGAACELL